jgi:predicted nucleotidyltransferase
VCQLSNTLFLTNTKKHKNYIKLKIKVYICKMKEELFNLIQSKAPGSIPLYLVVRGSHAYGTNLPTSDTDYAGVFVQSMDSILGMSYIEQVNDDKNDTVIYELRRFLELLAKNNPTILELLNTPEDCVIYKDPAFDVIFENRDKFLTKVCSQSFGGYAVAQIKKAKGQDKKQNWEKDKVTRKEVLDFVYVIDGDKSMPWKDYNISNGVKTFDEKFIGVVNVPHARDTYALFYDIEAHNCFSELVSEEMREDFKNLRKEMDLPMGLGFKGLVKVDEGQNAGESNALRLSSIPKGMKPICNIIYNKDSYTQHCKDYKSYQTWLEERNEQRWIDVKSHEQKIDGKNMMHCRRLMDMAREIAEGKGIVVRRPNAQELIDIRQGKVDLQSLIDHVESEIKAVDDLYKNSTLPDSVDIKLVESILINTRKNIYKLK